MIITLALWIIFFAIVMFVDIIIQNYSHEWIVFLWDLFKLISLTTVVFFVVLMIKENIKN